MTGLRPLLAATLPEGQEALLRFPLWVSPKIDGIRALAQNGQLWSRNGILIPNRYIQSEAERHGWHGLDGELTIGPPWAPDLMQKTQSGVRSVAGQPDFEFWIFDYWNRETSWAPPPAVSDGHLQAVPQYLAATPEELQEWEEIFLSRGYEGLMARSASSPKGYKYGRSTLREQHLVKIKRFSEDEALIIGAQERMENTNPDERSELGYAKRSTAASGLRPCGDLGAFRVRMLAGPFKGVEVDVGSGFTAAQRAEFWAQRAQLLGSIMTVKYFAYGAKDAPRFPIFKGFRPGVGHDI